ncbi:serine hydrolase [uncultured Oxalicibacterium sp.]|uniref:serine hydrolase n=1 Tax=uncultured Oxalicibacterium sp. TaxID=1168540 RepID=UPI0025F90619|nr:serine hydrolase [uncultured Oxalicibacterium sp.]
MMKSVFLAAALLALSSVAFSTSAAPLGSRHAIVVDEQSGEILFQKNATDIVPIASITKLMTAMVVLDARLDMFEHITITDADVDIIKNSSSRVPVGAVLSRHTLLELALMSSDNRAAHALARTYPGGLPTFRVAVRNKAMELNLRRTNIEEPTGLSPYNTSTASDLARMTMAAAHYPEIERITTAAGDLIDIEGKLRQYHNTNQLVSDRNWTILLSKTGFTREAGRCIVMRVRAAGRDAIMVLLNAKEKTARTADANTLHRMLTGLENPQVIANVNYKMR